MKKGVKLFGIRIHIHYTWWFIFALLTYSLSSHFFPHVLPDQTVVVYWTMGTVASLLLFLSVLLHEFSHSLVGRLYGLKVKDITLFFFGGIASLPTEDIKPKAELFMAAAGPAFSLVLSGLFFTIHLIEQPPQTFFILQYLFRINLLLALFNLMPAYPLDGGRMFRAALSSTLGDKIKATYIASLCGRIFAGFLIIIGIFTLKSGGLWFILIGGFLYFIAKNSYVQLLLSQQLKKISVVDLIQPNVRRINDLDKDLMKDYIQTGARYYIYKDNLLDIVRMKKKGHLIKIKSLPKLSIKANAYKAMLKMRRTEYAAVYEGKRFKGIITLPALMRAIDMAKT